MFSLYGILLTIQILSSLIIIGLVLLQHGKGADMSTSFGGGSSSGVFGARGTANILAKSTKWAAVVFFVVTCMLAVIGNKPNLLGGTGGVMDSVVVPPVQNTTVPSVPAAPDANSTVPAAPAPTNTSTVPAVPPAQ